MTATWHPSCLERPLLVSHLLRRLPPLGSRAPLTCMHMGRIRGGLSQAMLQEYQASVASLSGKSVAAAARLDLQMAATDALSAAAAATITAMRESTAQAQASDGKAGEQQGVTGPGDADACHHSCAAAATCLYLHQHGPPGQMLMARGNSFSRRRACLSGPLWQPLDRVQHLCVRDCRRCWRVLLDRTRCWPAGRPAANPTVVQATKVRNGGPTSTSQGGGQMGAMRFRAAFTRASPSLRLCAD